MPIAVACPCGAKLKAPDAAAGKRLKCPKCGAGVTVPPPDKAPEQDEPQPQMVKPSSPVDGDSDERPRQKSRPDRDDTTTRGSRRNRDDSATQATESRARKKSNLPLILGVAGGVTLLLAIGVVAVFVASGMNSQAKATGTTLGGGPESAAGQIPAGWKEFRAEGVSAWVPDSVNLSEPVQMKGKEPKAPLKSSRSWSCMQLFVLDPEGNQIPNPNPAPNPTGVLYRVTKGRLDPKFVAKYPQNSTAAGEAALKQIEDLEFLGGEWSDATLGDSPARQRTSSLKFPNTPGPAAVSISRVVMRGRMLYWCSVICKEADASGPLVTTFFDSFRVIEPDPVAAQPDEVEEPLPALPPVKLPDGWKKYKGEDFSVGGGGGRRPTAAGTPGGGRQTAFQKRGHLGTTPACRR